MAISRPLLIALAGAVLLAAAFLAMRVMSSASEPSVEAPPASSSSGAAQSPGPESPAAAPAAPASQTAGPDGPAGAGDRPGQAARTLPREVERSLDRGKVVVVTLFDRGGADDVLTGRRLLAAARRPGVGRSRAERVRVFPDFLSNVARYVGITQALQVTRAPAAIVIDEQRRARVLQGYTDASSLRQHVFDALD